MASHLRNLSREALVLAIGNITSLLLGLVGSILIARALGDEARGLYAWVFTVQGFGCQLAGLVTYHVARSLAAQTPAQHQSTVIGAFGLIALLGSFILALPILGYALLTPLGQSHSTLLLLAFVGVPLLVFATPLSALVHEQKHQITTLLSLITLRLALFIGTFALLVYGALTPYSLTITNVGSALVLMLFLVISLGVHTTPLRAFMPSMAMLRNILHHIGPAWLAVLGLYAHPKIGLLVLASHGHLASVGHLSVALTLFEALLALPSIATAVLISHLAQNSTSQAARRKITLVMMFGTALVAAMAALASPLFIPMLFGSAFQGAILPFQILMASLVLAALHQAWFSRLLHANSTAALILPPLFGCGMTWLCAIFWVIPFGAFGAAIATFIGYGVLVLSTYALKQSH